MNAITKRFLEYRKAPAKKAAVQKEQVKPQADFIGWKDNSETREQRQDRLIKLQLTHELHWRDKAWLCHGGNVDAFAAMRSKKFARRTVEIEDKRKLELWAIGKYTKPIIGGFR